MKEGSIVSCLRKGQCGPFPIFKTVVFSDVEAYGRDCCAASMPDPTVLSIPSSMHSIIFEDDCTFGFEAVGRAQLLHGEVITYEADADLARQHTSADFPEVLHPEGCCQTHVTDRWCSVNGSNGLVASVPDDTYTSGSIDWRLPPDSPSEVTQLLLEAISDGAEQAIVDLANSWAGTPILNIRTYGYFGGYQGWRDLQIPVDRMQLFNFELCRTWRDFVALEQISFVPVQPQPLDPGVDLHVVVSAAEVPAPVLMLLEIPSEEDFIRTVVPCPTAATGFAVLVRSGRELIEDARYTFWHNGRAHYGHELIAGGHGQFWKVGISRPQEDDVASLFGTAAVLTSGSVVPVCKFRPNPDIRIPFDDDLPIVRQTPQGPAYAGRVIPPPNWATSTLYRAASDAGACYRNSQGDLLVRVRTWVVEHVDGGRYAPRDFTMRAQLLVRLRERIKRVWQDVIGRNDHLGIHIVRPVPFADADGTRYLPILAEANRPGRSTLQPVLFAVREITALGVDGPEWCACLVPTVFTVADVHAACQPPAELHQLLVPQGSSQPRWMNARNTRVANSGLFVPIWWDDRLPNEESVQDATSLLQVRDSVQPSWPTLPQELYNGDEVWYMQRPMPSQAPTLGPVRLYGLGSAIATVTVDNASPLMEQLEPLWPSHLRSYADLHALHFVVSPPAFTSSPQATTYLMRFDDDHFSQVHEDDILALISIIMVSPERKQRLKVQWAPCRTTRNGLLEYLRLGWYCQQPDVLCFLYLNEVMWPLDDNGIRHLDNGDSIKVQLRSERFAWCDIAHSERISRARWFFMSSDEEGTAGTRAVAASSAVGRSTPRSRSRDRSLSEPLGLLERPMRTQARRRKLNILCYCRTVQGASLKGPMSVTAGALSMTFPLTRSGHARLPLTSSLPNLSHSDGQLPSIQDTAHLFQSLIGLTLTYPKHQLWTLMTQLST